MAVFAMDFLAMRGVVVKGSTIRVPIAKYIASQQKLLLASFTTAMQRCRQPKIWLLMHPVLIQNTTMECSKKKSADNTACVLR